MMDGVKTLHRLLTVLVVTGVLSGTLAFSAPVDLLEADSTVFIQDDGSADVIYSLEFRDNEGRTAIRKVGPFYEPVHFTKGFLHGVGAEPQTVRISAAGDGYFRVEFDDATSAVKPYVAE